LVNFYLKTLTNRTDDDSERKIILRVLLDPFDFPAVALKAAHQGDPFRFHWNDPPLTTAQGPSRGPGSRAGVSYELSRVFLGRLREVVAPDSFIDTRVAVT